MNIAIPTILGTQIDTGYFSGRFRIETREFALILPPKLIRQHAPAPWNESYDMVKDALSFSDGHANTLAMAKAGSKVAQWALDNGMEIPALDQLEMLYRVFKPGTETNSLYGRSGINLSAVPPTYPYSEAVPAQTSLKEFQEGEPEAFEQEFYWSSTQHAGSSLSAWGQGFGDGGQGYWGKGDDYLVCAVRRLPL